MALKSRYEVEVLDEALDNMMVAISYLKANSNYFTDDVLVLPAAETEMQIDYIINQIQFLKEEQKEV